MRKEIIPALLSLAIPVFASAGGLPPLSSECTFWSTKYNLTCASARFRLHTGKGVMLAHSEAGGACPHAGVEVDFVEMSTINGEDLAHTHAVSVSDGSVVYQSSQHFILQDLKFSRDGRQVRIQGQKHFPGGEIDGERVLDTLKCQTL